MYLPRHTTKRVVGAGLGHWRLMVAVMPVHGSVIPTSFAGLWGASLHSFEASTKGARDREIQEAARLLEDGKKAALREFQSKAKDLKAKALACMSERATAGLPADQKQLYALVPTSS